VFLGKGGGFSIIVHYDMLWFVFDVIYLAALLYLVRKFLLIENVMVFSAS